MVASLRHFVELVVGGTPINQLIDLTQKGFLILLRLSITAVSAKGGALVGLILLIEKTRVLSNTAKRC